MTRRNRCPKCNRRLPRQYQFIQPSYGTEPLLAVILTTAGFGALLFAFVHKWWPPDWWLFDLRQVDNVRLVAVSSVYGLGLALEGTFVAVVYHYMEKYGIIEPVEYEEEAPEYDHEVQLGDGLRAVTTQDGQRRWLRERGFVVPPEPERGALAKWLWAVHDGRCTLSQTGARTTLRDNPRTRQWAMDIMNLWCKAGWCEPVSGWNGDEPELGQGVTDVDEDVVRECASGGYTRMIGLLIDIVEAPYSESETAQPTAGLPPNPPTQPAGRGSGVGEMYELEPWPDEGNDD